MPQPRQILRLSAATIALSLSVTISACASRPEKHRAEQSPHDGEPLAAMPSDPADVAESPNPIPQSIASLNRMIGGEWRMTCAAGTSLYDTWYRGPGGHSLRVMTDGQAADGGPWHAIGVTYWHPGRREVCTLNLSPFAEGVAEGTFRFDGQTAENIIDMYQTGQHRFLKNTWTFAGPDNYRSALLESSEGRDYSVLAEWDIFRIPSRDAKTATPAPGGSALHAVRPAPGARRSTAAPHTPAADVDPKISQPLQTLAPLLGHPWDARGEWADGTRFHIRSTFEWVPLANCLYLRTVAIENAAAPTHLLDGYLFHHTGTDKVQCLILTDRGAVCEGEASKLDVGALELDLKYYDDGRTVRRVTRFDFEGDGRLRQRVWSVAGLERILLLDVTHRKFTLAKD